MARIGFIGTGEIAAHMVVGLAGQGHDILVSDRNATRAHELAARFAEVRVAANADVVAGADVVILCLMADVARAVLPALPFRAGQTVISAMVDVSIADLQSLCAPATDLAITIPLSSIAVGGSALPVYPDNAQLRALFGDRNLILPCRDEAALNAHFAASALASPILDLMTAGAGWLADETGDPAGAQTYVVTVFAGFLRQMQAEPDTGFADLLAALSTEGGLNASLRDHMRGHGAPQDLRDGMDGLKPRLGLTP
ncbi:NAD(P)-binding domain-containing protein [Aliiroseovarius crassostreae]|uniref:NAD(P)-binding domain-containing protein n=1 Tax=Aliiroseovarius crassostreae TaxID=154981 RepID=UPI003C7D0873